MKTLTLIRGAPGSGKSSLAGLIAEQFRSQLTETIEEEDCVICEADQFFTDHNGVYHWVPHLVTTAHEYCRRKVQRAMERGTLHIVVSNTSTVTRKIQFYLDLAKQHGYEVQHIVCFAKFGNIHKVPEEVVGNFREQLKQSLIQELKEGKL